MDWSLLPASLILSCHITSGQSLRLFCNRDPLIPRSIHWAIKIKPCLYEKLAAWAYWYVSIKAASGKNLSSQWERFDPTLSLRFHVCVYVVVIKVWMDSLPPCGQHNYSLSVIHAGSCSAKWDFPGDYSLKVWHACMCFVFIVDRVRVWTIVMKQCTLFVCVSVFGGLLSRGAQRACSFVTWGWLKHDWIAAGNLLWQAVDKKGEGMWSDVGSGFFHIEAVLISDTSACWLVAGCPV